MATKLLSDPSTFPSSRASRKYALGSVGEAEVYRSIPTALSTLRPATSPRLLAIRLGFTDPPASGQLFEPPIKLTGNVTDDVRRVVDEVARIEREFEGTLELVVHWGPRFHEVSNVRFHLC